MTFKSKLGIAALEELNVSTVGTPANEGIIGAVAGGAAGFVGWITGTGGIPGGVLSNACEKKKEEIRQLAREIEKVAETNGKKAVAEGKISAEDFRTHVKVGLKGILSGFILGEIFGPIYGAIKGSELEDLHDEMTDKLKELDRMLKKAQKEQADGEVKGNKGNDGKKPAAPKGKKVAKESIDGEEGDDNAEVTGDDVAAAAGGDAAATSAEAGDAAVAEAGADAGAEGDAAAAAGDDAAAGTDEAAAGADEAGAGDDAGAADDAGATDDAAAAGDDAAVTGDDAGADAAADAGADAGVDGADVGADSDNAGQDDAAGAGDEAGADADAGAEDPAAATDGTVIDGQDAAATSAAASDAEATGEPGDVVADADADPEADLVEEEMGAVDEIEEQTADVNEDVEKLSAATESLEGCVAILDAAAQRGGLDIFGASLLRNNVNTVTKSLKVKPLMLPALEDMETPSARIGGATDAKSQILAFIKRIIDAVKSAFGRLGEWIVETYKRLTNAFIAVERRAQKLAERVKSSKMVEGKIENSSITAKLSVNGKLVENLPAFLAKSGKAAAYLNDPKSYKSYMEILDLCEEMVKSPEKEDEIRGKIATITERWHNEMRKVNDGSTKITAAGKDLNHIFDIGLLGNVAVFTSMPAGAEGVVALHSGTANFGGGVNQTTPDALSQADAGKICAQVAELAKSLREAADGSRAGVKELNAEINKRKEIIVALAGKGASAIMDEAGTPQSVRKAFLFVQRLLLAAPKLPIHAINRAMPRHLSIALDYVAASIDGVAEAAPAAAPKQLAA